MNTENARKLKVGDVVNFPIRGDKVGKAKITHVLVNEVRTHMGNPFIWVTLGAQGVWPSTRL